MERCRSAVAVAAAAAAMLSAAACSRGAGTVALPDDPEQALRAIERRLIEAPAVRFGSSVVADGVVEADLRCDVDLLGPHVAWASEGTFVDREVDLFLRSEGDLLVGGNGDYRFERPVPPHLRPAIVVGLTRMGVLHNLARLAGAEPPDHAEGGIDEWLGLADVRWGEARERDGRTERPIEFGLLVDGEPSARVRLWVDLARGLPVEREQTVEFPQGAMRVVEVYRDWTVEEDGAS
jgi:hypothetical protein